MSETRTFTGEVPVAPAERSRLWWEIAIVLGLSLGQSAIYSIVTIIDRSTQSTPLSQQTAQVNPSQSNREVFDFLYQVLGNLFPLFAVALVVYLLWQPGRSGFRRIGFDLTRPGRDLGGGLLLFLVIGIPGILFYALTRLLGITVAVQASTLDAHWWTVPVLILAALRAALQEEVIVVGYLFTRLRQLGWGTWPQLPPVPGLRPVRRQRRDGRRLRLGLHPLGPRDAPRGRPHDHRHRVVRGLSPRPSLVAVHLRVTA